MAQEQSEKNKPSLWYRSVRALMRFLLFLLTDFKIHGQENVPAIGPFIVTSNHLGAVDLPATLVAIPRQATAFAATKHRVGIRKLILDSFNVIWVHRGTPDRPALREALEYLKNGGVLGVAPEGTRSPTRTLIRGKPGAAYLALQSGVPILPVGLAGTERVFQQLLRLRRPPVRVFIGKPYRLEASGDGRRDLQALADQMMLHIAELLPPEYRGVYAEWDGSAPATDEVSSTE